jgi:hypothetical protein
MVEPFANKSSRMWFALVLTLLVASLGTLVLLYAITPMLLGVPLAYSPQFVAWTGALMVVNVCWPCYLAAPYVRRLLSRRQANQ